MPTRFDLERPNLGWQHRWGTGMFIWGQTRPLY